MLCCDLEHLFVGPNSLEILKTGQNTHFSAFRALQLGPLVADSKSDNVIPCGLAKTPFPPSFVQIFQRRRQLVQQKPANRRAL